MSVTEIAQGIACLPITIANVYFVGEPGTAWVLVDSGVPGKAQAIQAAAEQLYGAGARPSAILLTHGHMDHAGSAHDLAHIWDVPICSHALEAPYLTGKSAYPPKDPTVGGAMAFLSRFFTVKPFDLRPHLQELPADGMVPELPGWQWFHTPGHAPGQVAYWNGNSRVLLAGDTFTTVDVDSPIALMTKRQEINKPPAPFTYDWNQARQSVRTLADLEPLAVGCGHGVPMCGPNVADELKRFAENFEMPEHGRYIPVPAQTDAHGIRFVPPPAPDPLPKYAAAVGMGVAVGAAIAITHRRRGMAVRGRIHV